MRKISYMGYFRLNIAIFGLLFLIIFKATAHSGTYTISGRITEEKTNTPLPGASIIIKGTYLWAVSNQNGEFAIQGVQGREMQFGSFLSWLCHCDYTR